MTIEQKEQITKDEIVNYIKTLEFKKSGMSGGVDKVDVVSKIYRIVEMYDAFLKKEMKEQRTTLTNQFRGEFDEQKKTIEEEHKKVLEEQKAAIDKLKEGQHSGSVELEEELRASKELVEAKNLEIIQLKEKINNLSEELAERKAYIRTLEGRVHTDQSGAGDVSRYIAEITTLHNEAEVLKAQLRRTEEQLADNRRPSTSSSAGIMEPFSFTADIEEILREAREEGQRIIDEANRSASTTVADARKIAQLEQAKALELRAQYKYENDMYKKWCSRVESEKKSVEAFLAQLVKKYNNVSSALSVVKDETEAFDIEKTFSAVTIQKYGQGNTNEGHE